jgi:hypothetical protein
LIQNRMRHGCRVRAYKDVFTASFELNSILYRRSVSTLFTISGDAHVISPFHPNCACQHNIHR